jgi:hypothetical protein
MVATIGLQGRRNGKTYDRSAHQGCVHFEKVNTSERFPDQEDVHFEKVNTSEQRDIYTLLTLASR